MRDLNTGRVLGAGLVAGLVFNVAGMASAMLLGVGESFARAGVTPDLASVSLHTALRFGIGIASVYLFAAVSGRFGTPVSAALRVGVAVWLIGYLPSIAVLHEIGFLTGPQAIMSAGWGVAEACLATWLGGRIYNRTS